MPAWFCLDYSDATAFLELSEQSYIGRFSGKQSKYVLYDMWFPIVLFN
jgi:hypothetical protein